ncbi:MAG: hypothetical protein H0W73_05075 [Bacteroidetes bacterium]|nr:hypothetical protein [Bacteroidota bacterium]
MKYKKYIKRVVVGLLSCILAVIISIFILFAFYKKELTATLISNLKEQYGLVLKVKDINVSFFSNWPNASIQLKDVNLVSEKSIDQPIITAGTIALSLDVLKLFKKEFIIESISIKDANVSILKGTNGFTNFEVKPKQAGPSNKLVNFEIKTVSIKNTQFYFIDKERGQKIDFLLINNTLKLKHEQDGIEAKFFGDVNVGGLLFKKEKGAFLANTQAFLNLHFSIFTKSKTLFVHLPSSVTIGNHPYEINSFIDFKKKQLIFLFQSENIDYEKGMALLNTSLQKKLETFNVSRSLNAKILLITSLGVKQDPVIIARISGKNNDITIGHSKIPYSNVSFNGMIVSLDSSKQKGDTEHARIIFKDIKGHLYDFPFTASVTLTNFDAPVIDINAALFIDASKIKFKPGEEFILKGACVAKIKYSGPANRLNKNDFLEAPMKLNAGLYFNNLSYQEKNKPYVYTVVGNTNLVNKNLQFENLLLKTDAGNVVLKGFVTGFTNYALGYSNGFKTTLDARSESFNLNHFLVNKPKKKTEAQKEENSAAYKKAIKDEQSNFEFNVSLFTKKLLIRNVKASNASIKLDYKNKFLDIRSVNMDACNGKLFAKGTIYDLNKVTAEVKIENMDVNSLFDQFENFGQKAVTSKNLQGNIFVDAKFKTELDDNMEVMGNTMDGEIKLKLKEGHLLNFEPLQNISDYVFKNRDFKDIAFSELNETCKIKGFEMEIQEMEIGSSVLNLFVTGKYHFKENSNINILIPWSNLKKRGKNYIPKSSGQTAENSKGLKLNYSGPPKKLKLSLGHRTI